MRNELYDLARCLKDCAPFESGDVGAQSLLRMFTDYCSKTDQALVLIQLCKEVLNAENNSSDSALSILMTLYVDNFTNPNFSAIRLGVGLIISVAFQECDPENLEKIISQHNEFKQNYCYLLANRLSNAARIKTFEEFAGICDILKSIFSRCKKEIWINLLFDTNGSTRGASGLFWMVNAMAYACGSVENTAVLAGLINMVFQAADGNELLSALTKPCNSGSKSAVALNILLAIVKKTDDLDSPIFMLIFYLLSKLDANALPEVIKDFIANYKSEIKFYLTELVLKKKIQIRSEKIDAVIALLKEDKAVLAAVTNAGLFPSEKHPAPTSPQSDFANCTSK